MLDGKPIRVHGPVSSLQDSCGFGAGGPDTKGVAWSPDVGASLRRSQRVQDHGDVDQLLQQRALNRREIAEAPRRSCQRRTGRSRRRRSRARSSAIRARSRVPDSRRSRRSTSRTTSAASAEAAAPRAPIATPISAAASAGASFTPSPTIITGPFLRSVSTSSTFWSGVKLRPDAVEPEPLGHRLGHGAAVAGRKQDAARRRAAAAPREGRPCPTAARRPSRGGPRASRRRQAPRGPSPLRLRA